MSQPPTVSILLVTKNGEKYLTELLSGVRSQRGRFRVVEILAVDSGSRDQTTNIVEQFDGQVINIEPEEFGHGRSRNLAASHASGEYLVFLTQDASPANGDWLARLIAPLTEDSMMAGGYSRHIPRSSCHPMEWRRIIQDELSGREQSCVNEMSNPDYIKIPGHFNFFSNVSSVLRKRIWEEFPLPDVPFAEDQIWAKTVIEAGYKTAYRADSLVYHSHAYGTWNNLRRHFDHGLAMQQPTEVSCRYRLINSIRAARKDLSFWRYLTKEGRARTLLRWGIPAVAWHWAGLYGAYLGARGPKFSPRLRKILSLQEGIKRR